LSVINVLGPFRVLGFSKQAFYTWKVGPVTERDWPDAHLINAALDVYRDDPAFGCRFIVDELEDPGFSARENWVARLCSTTSGFTPCSKDVQHAQAFPR
jgi:putative transposase